MSRNVYIAATKPGSGKSAIALGVMEMMVKNVGHVGFSVRLSARATALSATMIFR